MEQTKAVLILEGMQGLKVDDYTIVKQDIIGTGIELLTLVYETAKDMYDAGFESYKITLKLPCGCGLTWNSK